MLRAVSPPGSLRPRCEALRRALLVLLATLFALAGCGEGGAEDAARSTASASAPAQEGAAEEASAEAPRRRERPLPAFGGRLLDGERREISSFLGQRLVIFFFNPEVPEAAVMADAVAAVAAEAGPRNFRVVGVAMASSPETTRAFLAEHGLDVPVFDDSSARIASRLGFRAPVAVLGVDADGYLDFGMGAVPADTPDAATAAEARLRRELRLPEPEPGTVAGALDRRPAAPVFDAPLIAGGEGERFDLAQHRGEPAVILFFLHTCPHCHEALGFLKEALAALPQDARPLLLGVSVQDKPAAVRASLHDEGLDFFPVVSDPGGGIRGDYGSFAGVPDLFFVAADGRIEHRIQGWDGRRHPGIARMLLAKIAGRPVPMLLDPKGYTGNDACGICHDRAHDTWEYTAHAYAFDTLVTHGADRDAECVSCHVVGFGEPGGFSLESRPAHLEGVGCESCHGRGGPHLSPDFVKEGDYGPVCVRCHDTKHSLGFELASFQPRISHTAIAALSPEQREARLAGRHQPRQVLPEDRAFVGSEACGDCHAAEYATWSESGHARAVATLEEQDATDDASCLRCHVTGFGRDGGFPEGAAPNDHPDLARVGCESCHGPGAEHVREGSPKLGSIVSLGDKCDSCVILQICGSCHDEANDPGFRFEVEERIEAQRHGTIEAGTGRPLQGDAARAPSGRGDALARAFALLDAQRRSAGAPTEPEPPWTGR